MLVDMTPMEIAYLTDAVEKTHGCTAVHDRTEHVHEKSPTGETAWEGDVEVFTITGNNLATTAYAWTEPTGGGKIRVFAVLAASGVTSAVSAVQASILADRG